MKTRRVKKKIFSIAFGLALATSLVGCGAVSTDSEPATGGGEFQVADYIQERIDSGEPLRIMLSYVNPSLPFAAPLKAGMESSAEELGGVEARFIGPSDGDAAKQVAEIQTLITSQSIDGLAVASASNDALQPVIAQAIAAGIPVVSFNANNPESDQMGFIGQDLVDSGKQLAEALVALDPSKSGTVVVFSIDSGAGWSSDRFSGFKAAADAAGLDVVGPVNTGAEPNEAFNAVESTMLGQPDAFAAVSLDCCSFGAIGTWLETSGKAGQVTSVGFDLLPSTVEWLKDGTFNLTISQNPSLQGSESVRVLVEFLRNGTPIENINTGALLVTKDNVDEVPAEN